MKEIIKNILYFYKYSLSRLNPVSSQEFSFYKTCKFLEIENILDIGASSGNFAKKMFIFGFKGIVFSFEPIPSSYKQLIKKNKKSNDNWQFFNYALGDKNEKKKLFVSKNLDSSSFLEMQSMHEVSEPNSKYVDSLLIDVVKGKEFCSKLDINFEKTSVKIDVQGFEKNVLDGFEDLIGVFPLISLEVSTIELYSNQILEDQIREYMTNKGYTMIASHPCLADDSGAIIQYNQTFLKKTN